MSDQYPTLVQWTRGQTELSLEFSDDYRVVLSPRDAAKLVTLITARLADRPLPPALKEILHASR